MPKGLQSQTMNRIEDYLRNNQKQGHTCDDVASHVGLSVVTVRRYMNYLVEQQIIDSDMDYSTGGRPVLSIIFVPKCKPNILYIDKTPALSAVDKAGASF